MPETDPFRLRVLKALTAALQGINPANGYAHDLQKSVFRGRLVYGDDDPLPMVSIIEPPLPPDQLSSNDGDTTGDWDLLIQGFVADDHKNPTDPAYKLLADVKKCLALEAARKSGNTPNVLGMGGGKGKGNEIETLSLGAGVCRPADEVSAKAYFWLTVTLKLAEDPKNPFA